MMTEKYDVIQRAENILKQWDNDEIAMTVKANAFGMGGEYWKQYGKNPPFNHVFAMVISEFRKNRDMYDRVGNHPESQVSDSTRDLIKQRCYFEMLDLAQALEVLINLGKAESLTEPGAGLKKKIADLNDTVKALKEGKDEWEKAARDALEISQKANANSIVREEEYEILKDYGETLSPRFVEEAKRYHEEKTRPTSRLEESEDDKGQ